MEEKYTIETHKRLDWKPHKEYSQRTCHMESNGFNIFFCWKLACVEGWLRGKGYSRGGLPSWMSRDELKFQSHHLHVVINRGTFSLNEVVDLNMTTIWNQEWIHVRGMDF